MVSRVNERTHKKHTQKKKIKRRERVLSGQLTLALDGVAQRRGLGVGHAGGQQDDRGGRDQLGKHFDCGWFVVVDIKALRA